VVAHSPSHDENGVVRGIAISAVLALAVAGVSLLSPQQAQVHRPATSPAAHAVPPPDARLDINRASVDELMKVPGMTRSWAARIVRFRPYHSKVDLLEHGVLPSDVYDRIKDYMVAHRVKQ
jgi:DNA uptake protein ComE-like DNA-binding protein